MSIPRPSTSEEEARLPATVASLCPTIGGRHVREHLTVAQHELASILSGDEPFDAGRLDELVRRLDGAANWARWAKRDEMGASA